MNRFYSMQMEESQNGKVKESFRFVAEVKKDVWRDSREEQSEPTCSLSVRKISYTVR